mmetsp:Transcript_10452/g.24855  ORF Transcript_10452/g.24855 Transcript_10452/m.24855 type:complete len:399 (-) Transcript_10452:2939-4135(-)
MISFLLSAAGIVNICSAFSVPERTVRSISPDSFEPIRHHRQYQQRTELWSSALSSNEDLLPGISAIDEANAVISQQMEILQDSPYFRLFCVDILASCEYMPQELFECYSETCEVYPVDDEEVPENIREVDFQEHDFELDGWARWDMPSNDYYDLEEFPEGYTGYDGSEIWEFVHGKIAFKGYDYDDNHWKADFNKAVSGIHSLVSAHVTKGIQDKIDAGEEFGDDEVWRDPKVEFDRRLGRDGEQPMAMENLYFAYMLFLSAAAKAKDKLLADCESGSIDAEASEILKGFLELPVLCDPAVEVAPKKLHDHAMESQNNLWEARMRTRDLLRIMNCVQCNKCRLHGKVAMLGLSTALQIHLGRSGEGGDPNRIHRVELAALLCTIQKFSKAVEFCKGSR